MCLLITISFVQLGSARVSHYVVPKWGRHVDRFRLAWQNEINKAHKQTQVTFRADAGPITSEETER